MAAAERVGRLFERYALSMEEIDVREKRCMQVEVLIGGKHRRRAIATELASFRAQIRLHGVFVAHRSAPSKAWQHAS
jgi:hypothetical protein